MKILVVIELARMNAVHRSKTCWQDDYPDAEQILVDRPGKPGEMLYKMKTRSGHLPDITINWIVQADLLQIVKVHRPGFPIILVREVNQADPTNNLRLFTLAFGQSILPGYPF